jgi:hypothetical protein
VTKTGEASVIDVEELRSGRSFTFLGGEHGGIPVTAILDRSEPGRAPRCTGIPTTRSGSSRRDGRRSRPATAR